MATPSGFESPLRHQSESLIQSISVQRPLVAYLDGLHTNIMVLKRHQAETPTELNALMPSILSKSFRGEL